MDIEEEIVAFGETEVWVECDFCGHAFGGPGLDEAIIVLGYVILCADCIRQNSSKWESPQRDGP